MPMEDDGGKRRTKERGEWVLNMWRGWRCENMPKGRGCTGEGVCGNIAWRQPGCLEEVVGVFHGEGTTLLSYSVLLCTLYSVLLSDVLWISQVWWKQSTTESRNRCYHQCQDTALHWAVLYCTALYCTVQHCNVLYCTSLYCTTLHCTTLHCTQLH